jgi:hypothetical protein
MEISAELRQHLEENPNIPQVYFNKRGQHFFNAYSFGGKLFSRLANAWEDLTGDYEIVQQLTRDQILQEEIEEIQDVLKQITKPPRCQKVKQVSYVIINNKKYIPMGNQVIQLPQAGQPAVAYPVLDALVDAVSLQPIPGATATLVSRTVDNAAVAVIDSNGNLFPQGAGVVNVTSTNTWSYTDEDTQQPVTGKSETSTTPYTVTSGPEQVVQTETLGAAVPAGTVPAAAPPVAAAAVKA